MALLTLRPFCVDLLLPVVFVWFREGRPGEGLVAGGFFRLGRGASFFATCFTLRPFSPEALIGMVFACDRAGRFSEGYFGPLSLCGRFAPTSLEAWFWPGIVQVALQRGWMALRYSAAVLLLPLFRAYIPNTQGVSLYETLDASRLYFEDAAGCFCTIFVVCRPREL